MKNNILGGLVIFFVVVTCLILIDDLSTDKNHEVEPIKTQIEKTENENNLAVIESES
ncbi:hypothetical protein [Winogradskyella alexanderae]|uniref:Uncharacterized protein n=1 Tax=Winogradskyella alexanderae TaxID=2877123 RepID=A0ABS7XM21_9FLAO|nr:hypothetical protein [Winogradskyella alexanderae]MCA0131044.1 hypothetical protein [Winogradskyella alexanderae]